jgi:hypothetical protein
MKVHFISAFCAGAISANSTNETSADLYSRFLRDNPLPFKGWKEGFVAFAEYVAKSADNCGTLQQCADTMQLFFEESVASDPTNNFMTLVYCGAETDHIPDANGNVWWYDHYQVDTDLPYWIVDYVKSPGSGQTADPCNDKGMYFRGVEIDISISQQASPDWRHLKWDVSHSDPLFDYTPHPDCCNSRQGRCCDSDPKCSSCNASNCQTDDGVVPNFTNQCKLPNPCGKADVMQSMWRTDIQEQLYGKDTHVLMTICQKDGKWQDEDASCSDPHSSKCKTPDFKSLGKDQMGFRLFEPTQFSNSIWDHIEWDKAPRETNENGHQMGDGDGWMPLQFSQCCTTIVIAPQI